MFVPYGRRFYPLLVRGVHLCVWEEEEVLEHVVRRIKTGCTAYGVTIYSEVIYRCLYSDHEPRLLLAVNSTAIEEVHSPVSIYFVFSVRIR